MWDGSPIWEDGGANGEPARAGGHGRSPRTPNPLRGKTFSSVTEGHTVVHARESIRLDGWKSKEPEEGRISVARRRKKTGEPDGSPAWLENWSGLEVEAESDLVAPRERIGQGLVQGRG